MALSSIPRETRAYGSHFSKTMTQIHASSRKLGNRERSHSSTVSSLRYSGSPVLKPSARTPAASAPSR